MAVLVWLLMGWRVQRLEVTGSMGFICLALQRTCCYLACNKLLAHPGLYPCSVTSPDMHQPNWHVICSLYAFTHCHSSSTAPGVAVVLHE